MRPSIVSNGPTLAPTAIQNHGVAERGRLSNLEACPNQHQIGIPLVSRHVSLISDLLQAVNKSDCRAMKQ